MTQGNGGLEWTHAIVKLGALKPWERNPKRSTKKDAAALLRSWDELGQFQTIAVSPDGDVYDGHQRLSALLLIHGGEYAVKALVSSRLLTDEERRKIALYSRQIGAWDWDELSNWQPAELIEWGGFDADTLKDWKRDVAALGNFLAAEQVEPQDAEPQIDRAEELREKWGVELGQMWRLGDHRLICGDCTDPAVVARVMGGERADFCFTDPPYNVGVTYKQETNDNQSFDEFVSWCKSWAQYLPESFILTVGVKRLLWWRSILGDPVWTIAWIKKNGQSNTGLGGTNKWDPILVYGCKPDNNIDIVEANNDYSEKLVSGGSHPTPKPVELWQKMLVRFSRDGATIYEPFDGTGTTLIACENLSRKCRAIEISPAYVAVALQRWADLTGKTPELIDNGTPY